jgi:hypothetical protein
MEAGMSDTSTDSPTLASASVSPIPLNDEQERAAKEWAADDRLWTTQETVEFNLRTFARVVLKASSLTRLQQDNERLTKEVADLTEAKRNRKALAEQAIDRYGRWIGPMREAAKANGYALAVHGSLARDIDIIAAPWTEEAVAPDVLMEALRAACEGYLPADDSTNEYDHTKRNPAPKPYRRLAFKLYPCDGGTYFDVSVLPPSNCLTRLEQGIEQVKAEMSHELFRVGDHQALGVNADMVQRWLDLLLTLSQGRATP